MLNMECNKVNKLINYGVSLGILVFMLAVSFFPLSFNIIDKTILLEERHPEYFNNLSYQKALPRYILKGNENSENKMCITMSPKTYEYGDIIITIGEDSTILVKGSNNSSKDIWFEYSVVGCLSDGDYYYSFDSSSDNSVYSYAVARKYENYDVLDSRWFDSSQLIDVRSDLFNRYIFGIRVTPEARDVDISFYPYLFEKSGRSYEAAWFTENSEVKENSNLTGVLFFNMDENDYDTMNKMDWTLFNNSRKWQYKQFEKVYINLLDQTGSVVDTKKY